MTAKLYLGGFHIYPTPPPRRWVKTRFICVVRSKLPALWAQLGTWGKKIKLLFLPSAIHCHRRQRSQSESQPVVQEGSGDLQGYSALRWKPEGPERDERLFLRSRCNQSHVMREEQSAGADLRFQPWLCHLTSCGSSDKSLLSALSDIENFQVCPTKTNIYYIHREPITGIQVYITETLVSYNYLCLSILLFLL